MLDIIDSAIKGVTLIGGKIVDTIDKQDERVHQENMLAKKGEIEANLIEKRSIAKCAEINAQGEIDLKKQKLTQEREKEIDEHNERMKVIENDQIKDMKKLDYQHELDLLDHKDKSKQVEAQIEIDKKNADQNNLRLMEKLRGKLDTEKMKTSADIEERMKK